MENDKTLVTFLHETARYFESRPTNGEDAAHWANVANAETCRKIAARIGALGAEKATAQASAKYWAKLHEDLDEATREPLARLVAPKAELASVRAEIERAVAAEREACARAVELCPARVKEGNIFNMVDFIRRAATAIRARALTQEQT